MKAGAAPKLLLNIKVNSPVLTPDGTSVVHSGRIVANFSKFIYREAPDFQTEIMVTLTDEKNPVWPLASFPDSKKMVFSAGLKETCKLYIWDWATKKTIATLPTPHL